MAIIQVPIVHLEPVYSVLVESDGRDIRKALARRRRLVMKSSRSRNSRFNIFSGWRIGPSLYDSGLWLRRSGR
jgi:hypothetical protein